MRKRGRWVVSKIRFWEVKQRELVIKNPKPMNHKRTNRHKTGKRGRWVVFKIGFLEEKERGLVIKNP